MPSQRQIRYFLMVAEYQSFTAAADALFVAQPALSRQIAELETELGFPLFERLPRGVRLTPGGQHYRERMQAVTKLLGEAAEEARYLARGEAGVLRLLHSSSLPVPHFMPWLQRLLDEVSGVRIELDRIASEQQLAELAAGKADMGLVRLPLLRREPAVSLSPLPPERLWVLVPQGHALQAQPEVHLAQLADFPFVSAVHRERGGLARRVTDLCLRAGFSPQPGRVISRKTAMLDLVAAGLGIAVIPEGLAQQARAGTVCLPLADADAFAESALVLPLRPSPLAQRLAAIALGQPIAGGQTASVRG